MVGQHKVSRRTLAKSAAWSAPIVAVAAAAPAAAASTGIDIGAFYIGGTCGLAGVVGPGFVLGARSVAVPVGTSIYIEGAGIADIGVFTVEGGTADVWVLSPTSRNITLTQPLAAGAALTLRTTLSISVAYVLDASVSLPPGFTGTNSKTTATVNTTTPVCTAT